MMFFYVDTMKKLHMLYILQQSLASVCELRDHHAWSIEEDAQVPIGDPLQ